MRILVLFFAVCAMALLVPDVDAGRSGSGSGSRSSGYKSSAGKSYGGYRSSNKGYGAPKQPRQSSGTRMSSAELKKQGSPNQSGYGNTNSRDHAVRGHTRKDGTYVKPHRATNQNQTQRDNFSTRGNVNPYTGKPGTVTPNH